MRTANTGRFETAASANILAKGVDGEKARIMGGSLDGNVGLRERR
jgi:hypothetical protein